MTLRPQWVEQSAQTLTHVVLAKRCHKSVYFMCERTPFPSSVVVHVPIPLTQGSVPLMDGCPTFCDVQERVPMNGRS